VLPPEKIGTEKRRAVKRSCFVCYNKNLLTAATYRLGPRGREEMGCCGGLWGNQPKGHGGGQEKGETKSWYVCVCRFHLNFRAWESRGSKDAGGSKRMRGEKCLKTMFWIGTLEEKERTVPCPKRKEGGGDIC